MMPPTTPETRRAACQLAWERGRLGLPFAAPPGADRATELAAYAAWLAGACDPAPAIADPTTEGRC